MFNSASKLKSNILHYQNIYFYFICGKCKSKDSRSYWTNNIYSLWHVSAATCHNTHRGTTNNWLQTKKTVVRRANKIHINWHSYSQQVQNLVIDQLSSEFFFQCLCFFALGMSPNCSARPTRAVLGKYPSPPVHSQWSVTQQFSTPQLAKWMPSSLLWFSISCLCVMCM